MRGPAFGFRVCFVLLYCGEKVFEEDALRLWIGEAELPLVLPSDALAVYLGEVFRMLRKVSVRRAVLVEGVDNAAAPSVVPSELREACVVQLVAPVEASLVVLYYMVI